MSSATKKLQAKDRTHAALIYRDMGFAADAAIPAINLGPALQEATVDRKLLGIHVLVELRECDPKRLDDLDFLRETLLFAVKSAGGVIMGESFHRFSPQGVTGILSISESHVSIHTWPEHGYAAMDVFAVNVASPINQSLAILIVCAPAANVPSPKIISPLTSNVSCNVIVPVVSIGCPPARAATSLAVNARL